MREALDNAILELKRVDHLFYVSLKYTRTVDMIRHMVDRIINTFTFGIEAMLKKAKEEGKINEVPENLALRCKLLLETFPNDKELEEYINFYLLQRKIIRAPYTKREEFRRHVTMTSTIPNGEIIEVDIDKLKENYEYAKKFVHHVRYLVTGEELF